MAENPKQLPLSDRYRQEEAFKQALAQLNWYTMLEELRQLEKQYEDKMEDDKE